MLALTVLLLFFLMSLVMGLGMRQRGTTLGSDSSMGTHIMRSEELHGDSSTSWRRAIDTEPG